MKQKAEETEEKLSVIRDIKLVYKRFWPYVKMHKWHYCMVVIGMILFASGSGASAYVIKPIIDNVFSQKSEAMLYIIPLVLIGIFFVKGLGAYMQGYYLDYISAHTGKLVRQSLMKRVLSFELGFFNRLRSGEILSRMYDADVVVDFAVKYILNVANSSLTIISYACVIIYNGSFLAFLALLIMPLSIIPIRVIARKLRKISNDSFQTSVKMSSKTIEILNNMEIIKASSGEKLEYMTYEASSDELFRLHRKGNRVGLLVSPFMEFCGSMGMAIIVVVGGLEVLNNNMTSGEFFSVMAAMLLLYKPLKSFNSSIAGVQAALVANERLSDIIDRESEIKDGDHELQGPIEKIEVKNASLAYSEDNIAIHDISTTFNRNSITAIIGKSGSGKSSLMNLLLRLYDTTSGSVLINGYDIKDIVRESLHNNVSIVTQRIFIFHGSIASNVAYGMDIDEDKVIDALKKAKAYEFVELLKDGIHTILDEFGTNISGGQRQRIAIARAIYKNPDVLILDEATSALDEETEDSIKDTLKELSKDKILIIVAHRPSTIELAERVIRISEGRIINEWTQKEYQDARQQHRISDEDIA